MGVRWLIAGAALAFWAHVSCAQASQAPDDRASCFVTASELARWRELPGLVLVDTRSEAEFRQVRVPGSIHARPHTLRVRHSLKERPLLLLHAGGTGRGLERTCLDLRAAGFASVGILEGGLVHWAHVGGALVGAAESLKRPAPITAEELWRDRDTRHWVVLDATSQGTARLDTLSRQTIRVSTGDPQRLRTILQRLAARVQARAQVQGLPTFIAIVGQEGRHDERLVAAAVELDVPHLYRLVGGVEAVERLHTEPALRAGAETKRNCPTSTCGAR